MTFVLTANAYQREPAQALQLAAGATARQGWPLAASGYWYDLSVQVAQAPQFLRRLAGRLATGAHGISDPALGPPIQNAGASAGLARGPLYEVL